LYCNRPCLFVCLFVPLVGPLYSLLLQPARSVCVASERFFIYEALLTHGCNMNILHPWVSSAVGWHDSVSTIKASAFLMITKIIIRWSLLFEWQKEHRACKKILHQNQQVFFGMWYLPSPGMISWEMGWSNKDQKW